MKKHIAILLTIFLIMTLTACGSKAESGEALQSAEQKSEEVANTSEPYSFKGCLFDIPLDWTGSDNFFETENSAIVSFYQQSDIIAGGDRLKTIPSN